MKTQTILTTSSGLYNGWVGTVNMAKPQSSICIKPKNLSFLCVIKKSCMIFWPTLSLPENLIDINQYIEIIIIDKITLLTQLK